MERSDRLREIKNEVIGLKKSPLYEERVSAGMKPVIGEGDHSTNIMFIGEAPGKNEAETGRPFCGTAGKTLDAMLESVSMDRAKVYVTNIVKDRPPCNRDPSIEEIELYAPFLDRQIEIIEPKVLATLGRFSMTYILKRYGGVDDPPKISKQHGVSLEVEQTYGRCVVFPLYHPAAASYNGSLREILMEDMKKLRSMIDRLGL